MDYQLDNKCSLESLSSTSIITSLDSTDITDNISIQQQLHHHNGSFISLRCRPTLTTLPPELLSKISYNLSLCDYSFLSRTCARLHSHLFHPAELVFFLKTRYRLSIHSGSIVIFAYLANMQVRAPLLLERIFEDFFADSPLRLQEEQKWKLHCQQQRLQLSNNTYQLNQAILSKVNGSTSTRSDSSSLEYQRMDGIEVHKAAEKATRQAKSDAVRMLGVLYALDKTHIGPSSSTNALVLIGACDPSEPTPLASAPAPELSLTPVAETGTTTALETTTSSSSVVFAPSSFSATAPVPISVASSFSSHSKATTATTTADADDTTTPSLYHAGSSSLSAFDLPSPSSLQRIGQDPLGRSHSLQEGYGQQDLDIVPRSRSTSLDYSDLTPQHQQHQATTNIRNVRKRPSPSIPSKDGKLFSLSSSSSWESPLTQHAQSDSSRFSPSRAISPASARHNHHQRQRAPPSLSPSSSSALLTSVFSLAVPGSKTHQSGGEGSTVTGTVPGGGAASANTSASTSGGVWPRGPSQTSISLNSFSSTSSLFSSSSISSLPSSSVIPLLVHDEARQRSFDSRNKRHMNLQAMMKERAMNGDREAMEYGEYSHELAHRGCWPVDLDQDFDMDTAYCHRPRAFGERGEDSRDGFDDTVAEAFASEMHEMDDLPMDVDDEYVVRGGVAASNSGSGMDKYMRLDSTTPTVTATKPLSSSSSYSSRPPSQPATSAVSPVQQADNKSNTSSLSSSKKPLPSSVSFNESCSSHSTSSSFVNWPMLPEREKDRENESEFGATPLRISLPHIEANTNSSSVSGSNGRLHGSGNGNSRNGSGGSSSSWRMDVPSVTSSSVLFSSQGLSFRHPRGSQNHQQQQQQSQQPLSRSPPSVTSTFLNVSTTAPSTSTTTTTATNMGTTAGTQQKMQQILNRHDKIAFLTKYTDRMHLKLQALGIEDWGQGDIQRKKTYQLMIQHNDKTGEKDLVKFYLGRYGGSVTTSGGDAATDVGADVQDQQQPIGPLGLPLSLASSQGQGQEQQGTPLVVQA